MNYEKNFVNPIPQQNNYSTTSNKPITSSYVRSKYEKYLIGIIVFLVVIFIVTIVLIFVYAAKRNQENHPPGSSCQTADQCNIGLSCSNNICTIPITGSCLNFPNNCAESSICTNNVCTANTNILRLQNNNCNIARKKAKQKEEDTALKGTVVPISKEKALLLSTNPDMTDSVEFYKGSIISSTLYEGKVYVVTDEYTINVHGTDGTFYKTYISNIPINGSIEILNNDIYAISNNKLYKATLTPNGTLNFIYQNETCYDIVSDPSMTQIYKKKNINDNNVILGDNGEYIDYNNRTVSYYDSTGNKQDISNNGQFPILYNGNIYLNPYKTRVYDGIFMSVV